MMSATRTTLRTRHQRWLIATGAAFALFGCTGSDNTVDGLGTPGQPRGNPSTGLEIYVDETEGGQASELRLSNIVIGRLVRVFGLAENLPDGQGNTEGSRIQMRRDFLIGANNIGETDQWRIEVNPATGEESLIIFRNVNPDTTTNPGFADNKTAFDNILQGLAATANPVFDAGTGGSGLFTMVPRNATLSLQFDDLLDPVSINANTIDIAVGTPSITPYQARILADPNYGDVIDRDGNGSGEFYPSRILIDMAISQQETLGTSLDVNNEGLPASADSNLTNVQLRIPTSLAPLFGQSELLVNLTDHRLSTVNNGTVDFNSPTLDLVRAVRSGGPEALTGDPFNGYLRDETPPQVVVSLTTEISGMVTDNFNQDPTLFLIENLTFDSSFCAQKPLPGDLLQQAEPPVLAVVELEGNDPDSNGLVTGTVVRLLTFPEEWDSPSVWLDSVAGESQFISAYNPTEDVANRGCFLGTFPSSTTQGGGLPGVGILPTTSLGVSFSEAMNSASVNAFDSMRVTRVDPSVATPGSFDIIVGSITETTDLRTFSVTPTLPLRHITGQAEQYFLTVPENQTSSVTDLAGNRLIVSPASEDTGPLTASIDPDATGSITGGRVSRFSAADEEPPFAGDEDDPFVEWSGQIIYNTSTGTIRPRPVVRSEGLADRSNAFLTNGATSLTGVIDPLSRFGSKTQMLWRYTDVGLDLQDPLTGLLNRDFLNIDIEGMNWAPFGGQVNVDTYSQFEMRMSHANFLPDELLFPLPPFPPIYPASGLVNIFNFNLLDEATDPQAVVHDRDLGYVVNPGDIFITGEGTRLIPFPLNEGANPSQFRYYTWRDTSINRRSAPDTSGARLELDYGISGDDLPVFPDDMGNCAMGGPAYAPIFTPTQVKTAGLPLLVEFRCFPDDSANSTNNFDTSIAITTSTMPFFRAFSAGGIDTNQVDVRVDPDLEDMANGGFNPNSTPASGAPTFGLDNNIYLGSLDFVVRVSRAYSVWWPIEDNINELFPVSEFFPPVVEPTAAEQPVNTSMDFAYRAAFTLPAVGDQSALDPGFAMRSVASQFDPYGDHYDDTDPPCPMQNDTPFVNHDAAGANLGISFLAATGNAWQEDVEAINGANFYQVRVSFISNPQTGLVPTLSSFAMSWANGN